MGYTNKGIRVFSYFKKGYHSYMLLLVGLLNVLTSTYFLLIDQVSILGNIFTSFELYVVIIIGIGFPTLILVGWTHFRRSGLYSQDLVTYMKNHPYFYKYRFGHDRLVGDIHYTLYQLNLKIANKEKLTPDEINNIKSLEQRIENLLKGGHEGNPPPGVIR